MPPSLKHQGLTKLVGESPNLWPTLLRRGLGIELPERLERVPAPETIRELPIPEHAADIVVGLRGSREAVFEEAFPHEIQLRPDSDKYWSWPIHVAGLRTRLECPITLVVLATNERTAKWAAKPIDLGRGRMVLRPLVIGPSQIPTDLDLADAKENPEFATLAVMIHGTKHGTRHGSKRLSRVAIKAALEVLDRSSKRGTLLLELIAASLNAKTLREIEDEMELGTDICFTKIGRRKFAEGRDRGRQEGRQEGRRLAISLVLRSRGLRLTAAQRRRIESCTDDDELEAWLRRASTVERTAQVFRA